MRASTFAPLPAGARVPPLWAQPLVAVGLFLVPLVPTLLLSGLVLSLLDAQGRPAQALFGDWRAALAIMVTYAALLVAGVLLWTRLAERRPLATLGLCGRVGGREAAWLAAGLVWSAAVTLLFGLIPGGETGPDLSHLSPAALAWLPLFAAMLLLLAFMEELVCRGWMLSSIAARAGAVAGMVLSGLVFAALHVLPWELTEPAKLLSFGGYAAMGAGLCALALHAGQLWTPTAFHLGYNAVFAALFLAQPNASPEQLWRMLESEPRGLTELPEAAAWLAANAALAGVFVTLWHRKAARGQSNRGRPSGETVS
ncbi:MAG TPA: type II CAAX endopeptidase family protein [Caulobacteraceae bacterium]|jgi:hypothetical protein